MNTVKSKFFDLLNMSVKPEQIKDETQTHLDKTEDSWFKQRDESQK